VLNGGKDQVAVADVLDVMQEEFTRGEMEIAGLAGPVADVAGGAVMGVLAAPAGIDGCPEVVQNVPVRVPAFAGRQSDLPDPGPWSLTQQPGSDVPVVGMGLELRAELG